MRATTAPYAAILALWQDGDTWLTHRQIAAKVGHPDAKQVYAAVSRMAADGRLDRREIAHTGRGQSAAEFRVKRQVEGR